VFPGDSEPDQRDQPGLDLSGLGDSGGLAGLLAQAQQMQQQLLAAQA
jgi:hypothetical protein